MPPGRQRKRWRNLPERMQSVFKTPVPPVKLRQRCRIFPDASRSENRAFSRHPGHPLSCDSAVASSPLPPSPSHPPPLPPSPPPPLRSSPLLPRSPHSPLPPPPCPLPPPSLPHFPPPLPPPSPPQCLTCSGTTSRNPFRTLTSCGTNPEPYFRL